MHKALAPLPLCLALFACSTSTESRPDDGKPAQSEPAATENRPEETKPAEGDPAPTEGRPEEAAATEGELAESSLNAARGPGAGLIAQESIGVVKTCNLPPAPAPGTIRTSRDLVYARPGGQLQKLDIVAPIGPGPFPLVVLIHGGGFTIGDKSGMLRTAEKLAGAGFVAATVNYRLSTPEGANSFPAPVSDVRCAVRWLRANAGTYGIDAQRVGALGGSAGAHLAAMLGVGARSAGLDDGTCAPNLERQPVTVRAVAAYYTPTDFRNESVWMSNDNDGQGIMNLLGGPIGANPALAALASPITHVSGTAAPFFLAHGSADGTVPVEQSRSFHTALRGAGAKSTYVELQGVEHGFPLLSEQYPTTSCTTIAFLRKYLTP